MPNPVLTDAIDRVASGEDLSADDAAAVLREVMEGEASEAETAAFLIALRTKGETVEELIGLASTMRALAVGVAVGRDDLLDTAGTGGGKPTFNVSTTAAFVAAGAGCAVAKHGNRSATGRSGSADVLEALGVDIGLPPARAALVLREAGFVFLFAPAYHPAMRHVGPVRKELGVATIMNLLGPLANPAGVRRQVIGVASEDRGPLVAEALARLGADHALVVHAAVGMDEVSPSGRTRVWEIRDGGVSRWEVDPAALGLECDDLDDLAGGEPEQNARRVEQLLDGHGASAERCAVLLNAAAALYVSGHGWTLADAVSRARGSLESGAAMRALQALRLAAPAGERQPAR